MEDAEGAELQRKMNDSLKGELVVPLYTYIGEYEGLARGKAQKEKEA